jgi:nucleoside-diphosphate-sugar epimerase
MTTLITGANGFVGSALVNRFCSDGLPVRAAARSLRQLPVGAQTFEVVEKLVETDWSIALADVQTIVHLAARVHVAKGVSEDSIAEFRRVNTDGTANLARQAVAAGVKRFVFISSIKVNGEITQAGAPFKADDEPAPEDPYGVSKFEAEQALRKIAEKSGMETVIIRPPLVYGPGVKANFATMVRWLASGVPLPLGGVTHNRRSLVALDNLVDLITMCLDHPAAANQIFLVSDGEDVSTAQLLRRMGSAMGRPARLVSVPQRAIEFVAAFLGRKDTVQRLCGSLQVDISKTRQVLGWTPRVSLDEGLQRTAANVTTRW